MKKKCLAVGIILLFVGTCIIPATAQDTEKPLTTSRGWLYVGGSGPGNYTRIQDAINNSYNGDTIYIYNESSPYYEHLWIQKSITLIGEEKNSTIIDGNGIDHVLSLDANAVNIKNLTIRNGRHGVYFLHTMYYNCSIVNTIITQCSISGISARSTFNTVISKNLITNTMYYGIYLTQCNNDNVSENRIENNSYDGIRCSSCSSVLLQRNIIGKNNGSGIFLDGSIFMNITGNVFGPRNGITIRGGYPEHWNTHSIHNNSISGKPITYYQNCFDLDLSGESGQIILANCSSCRLHHLNISEVENGIQIGCCQNIVITENSLKNNTFGIRIDTSMDILFFHNTITQNKYGVFLVEYDMNITIQNNTLCHNKDTALVVIAAQYNRIVSNTISDNDRGIYFGETMMYRGEIDNVIVDNLISNNRYGIYCVYSDAMSKNNHFYHNRIINNTYSAYDEFEKDVWNSRYPYGGNYWSDYSGVDANQDGIGDSPYEIPMYNQDEYPLMSPYTTENLPPTTLQIKGPIFRRAEVPLNYSYLTSDPNGDCLFYYIDWGDGVVEQCISPYDVEMNLTLSHTWKKQGIYTILVTAEDPFGEKTNTETMKIYILPKKGALFSLFLTFLERFPVVNQLLEWILSHGDII